MGILKSSIIHILQNNTLYNNGGGYILAPPLFI